VSGAAVVVTLALASVSWVVAAGAIAPAASAMTNDTNVCTATLDPPLQDPALGQQVPITLSTDASPQPHDTSPLTLSKTQLTVTITSDIMQTGVNLGVVTDGMPIPTHTTFIIVATNTFESTQSVEVDTTPTAHVIDNVAQPIMATANLPDTIWHPIDGTQPVTFSELAMTIESTIDLTSSLGFILTVTFQCAPSDPPPALASVDGTPIATDTTLPLTTVPLTTAPPTTLPQTPPAWTRVSSANAGSQNNDLFGVSCVAANRCVAVGRYLYTSNIYRTLAEYWNGISWTRMPSVNPGVYGSQLNAVSCVSVSHCTAVGFDYDQTGYARTLIETRSGGSWVHVPSPNAGNDASILIGVSCLSTTSCVAAGLYYHDDKTERTLTEHWNGSHWTRIASPNVGIRDNEFIGVSCATTHSCMAVGYYFNSSNITRTLVEHWNGSSWTLSSSADVGTNHNYLEAVDCVSSTWCTAVGGYDTSQNVDRTLVEAWHGHGWSHVASPNVGARNNDLYGLACTSTTACTAAGLYRNSSNVQQTLIEHWNGAAWSTVPSPNAGTSHNVLLSVSCVTDSECTVAGLYRDSAKVHRTLIERSG
jgi:hypothetical protein